MTRSSAIAMIADVPGGRLVPMYFRSSSLKPLSRTFPHTPPAPAPTAAEAMMLGGKMRPAIPPAMAPRLAHFLPLGSAVSSMCTLSSAVCTMTAASIRSMAPARWAAWKSFSAAAAPCSSPYAAMKSSTVVAWLLMCHPPIRVDVPGRCPLDPAPASSTSREIPVGRSSEQVPQDVHDRGTNRHDEDDARRAEDEPQRQQDDVLEDDRQGDRDRPHRGQRVEARERRGERGRHGQGDEGQPEHGQHQALLEGARAARPREALDPLHPAQDERDRAAGHRRAQLAARQAVGEPDRAPADQKLDREDDRDGLEEVGDAARRKR